MKRRHFIAGTLVSVACGLVVGTLLLPKSVSGQGQRPKSASKKAPGPKSASKKAPGPKSASKKGLGPRSASKQWPGPRSVPKQGRRPKDDPGGVSAEGTIQGPLPPPVAPPDLLPLTTVQKLGKFLMYDATLSNPPGYACGTCHIPSTGFTGPLSDVNAQGGQQPGVVPGRYGNRKPQTYSYATLSPIGPYFDNVLEAWVGGNFWDGRAVDSAAQALGPPVNPNEMNNTNFGTDVHEFSPLLVQKIQKRPYSHLFKEAYGRNVFTKYTPQELYLLFGAAIASFENSGEINSFSSKYDASQYGTPPQNLYTLTASEERGRQLYFGTAMCSGCHSATVIPPVLAAALFKDTFTAYCFANIGVPRNIFNPYYSETDAASNPLGYNPLGTNYIDQGLGGNATPAPGGTIFNTWQPGDDPALNYNGLFQTPTCRNVDKRPYPTFVKAYMHNGVFKSLAEVVHFYNTRNLTTADLDPVTGLVTGVPSTNPIDLTNPTTYAASLAGRTPIWTPPEVMDPASNLVETYQGYLTLTNPTGLPPSQGGQIGNLGLSVQQEADLVAFLQILTDDYTAPNPISPPPPPAAKTKTKKPRR